MRPPYIIGYDAKRFTSNRTGLGNYSRYTIQALAENASEEIKMYLASASAGDISLYESILKKYPALDLFSKSKRDRCSFDFWWRNISVQRELKKREVQLYHGLSNELPWGIDSWKIPSVVTVHDLIYELYPQYYTCVDAKLYHYKYKRSCQKASKIIAVSECTKRDIIRLYGIPEEKIEVVYQGCDSQFRIRHAPDEIKSVKEKYHLPERYLLSVGSIEERKNAALIVEAMPLLKDSSLHLVLVGKRTKYTDFLEARAIKLGVQTQLHIYSNILFADLPKVYQGAEVFVYPSFYEGFGIPLLEALCSGVPVIGATGSCLEEAGGVHSLYTDPRSPEELASLIKSIPMQREKMVEEGYKHALNFMPKTFSTQILSIYKELIV